MERPPIVGRDRELHIIAEALATPDPRVLSVSGIAGVGKSTMIECSLRLASGQGIRIVATNLRDAGGQAEHGVVALLRLASQGPRRSSRLDLGRVGRLVERYEDARQQVLAGFKGSEQQVGDILRVGLEAARVGLGFVPGASIVQGAASPELIAAVSNAVRAHTGREERRLLEDPGFHLGSAMVADIRRAASKGKGTLLTFDEYEHVAYEVDAWLRRLVAGHFGELPARTTVMIAGRLPLGRDWLAGAAQDLAVVQLRLDELTTEAVVHYLQAALTRLGMADRATEVAEMLGKPGQLPVLLERAAANPERLVAQLAELHRPSGQSYDWGAALEDYVHRLSGPSTRPGDHRLALRALSIPRRLNDRRARVVLDAAGVQEPNEYVEWLQREDLIDPRAPAFTMFEPIRRVLVDNLRQHDPEFTRSLHREMAAHYEEQFSHSRDLVERAEAQREATYHQVLSSAANPVTACLQGMLRALPGLYLDLPQWATAIEELQDALHGGQATHRLDLSRLSDTLTTTWELSTPWALTDLSTSTSLTGDFLLYRLLNLDPPAINEDNTPHWLELFVVRTKRLSQEMDLLLETADILLRNLYRKCERDFGAQRESLLRFCVAYELAEVSQLQGRISQAVFWSQRSLDLVPTGSSPLLLAMAHAGLGSNLKRSTEFGPAISHLHESIACFRQLEGTWNDHLGTVLLEMANCHSYLGETNEATRLISQLRELDVGRHNEAKLRHRLGWQLRLEGKLERSLEEHEAAIHAYETMLSPGHAGAMGSVTIRMLRASAQHSCANTLTEMHRFNRAHTLFTDAIQYFDTHGMRRHVGIATKDRVPSLHALNGFEQAAEAYATASEILDAGRDAEGVNASHIAEGCLVFSRIAAIEGRSDQAMSALDRARSSIDRLEREARSVIEVRWHLERSLVAALSDDPTAAHEFLPRVSSFAAGAEPVRHDLLAQADAVRAVVLARTVGVTKGLAALQQARDVAMVWNPYLPYELERIWARATMMTGQPSVSEELIDTYDAQGTPLGVAVSSVVHEQGLWHRSFHCWITDVDEQGRLGVVFQRRGPNKRDYPNYLDISVAGHYQAGEGVEGGIRELREELGLQVREPELVYVARRSVDERLYNGTINREWQDVYWLHLETFDLSSVVIGYPEVTGMVRCRLDLLDELLHGEVGSIRAVGRSTRSGSRVETTTIDVTSADFIADARHYIIALCQTLRSLAANTDVALRSSEQRLGDGSVWQVMATREH